MQHLRAGDGVDARPCRAVDSEADVYLWVTKRAGRSGRTGSTLGTLICAKFHCSANVRG
ncbi:FBP domain-containing protein [Specibacter cremeus]|uniref:FBP domain-containing protein n=1 Tax=Specibacter cremeus TaxID=1629051 RepID=UPI003B82E0D4